MSLKHIKVAIGLIVTKGKVLVGFREQSLHQGGCYEFPGGKVEINETPEQAVIREVKEEVGIQISVARLFHELVHEYSDRIVHLFFYTCIADSIEPIDNNWQWVAFNEIHTLKFPDANREILKRLDWQRKIAITPIFEKFQDKIIQTEINSCYVRVEDIYAEHVIEVLHHQLLDPKLIIKRDTFFKLSAQLRQMIFAVHLNSKQLYEQSNLDQFKNINVIAACHTQQDIDIANRLGCDAIFLSPVKRTTTHPDYNEVLGWDAFSLLANQAMMPVYALGGIQLSDFDQAQLYSAYGIAGISDFWQDR